MNSVVFIYQPKSGDRVFMQQTTPEIGVVKWENGCRHVVGGVHLWWDGASRSWRSQATTLLTNLLDATGGVAWDVQGELHAVVPAAHAVDVHRYMEALSCRYEPGGRKIMDFERMGLETQLVAAGCANLVLRRAEESVHHWFAIQRRAPATQPQLGEARVERVVADDGYRFEVRVPAGTMANGDAVEVAIGAPMKWFDPARPHWIHLGRDLRLDLPAAPADAPTTGGLEEIRPSDESLLARAAAIPAAAWVWGLSLQDALGEALRCALDEPAPEAIAAAVRTRPVAPEFLDELVARMPIPPLSE